MIAFSLLQSLSAGFLISSVLRTTLLYSTEIFPGLRVQSSILDCSITQRPCPHIYRSTFFKTFFSGSKKKSVHTWGIKDVRDRQHSPLQEVAQWPLSVRMWFPVNSLKKSMTAFVWKRKRREGVLTNNEGELLLKITLDHKMYLFFKNVKEEVLK